MGDQDEVDEVLAGERHLLLPEVRSSRAALEALLHPEFREVGASGRAWDREDLVAELVATEHPPAPTIESPRVDMIAEGVALLTYSVTGPHGASLRSSVWTRSAGRWRVRFHQGTRVDLPLLDDS